MALCIPVDRNDEVLKMELEATGIGSKEWDGLKRRVRELIEEGMEDIIFHVLSLIDDEMELLELVEEGYFDDPAEEEPYLDETADDPYEPTEAWNDVWEKAANASRYNYEGDEDDEISASSGWSEWSGWDEDETEEWV